MTEGRSYLVDENTSLVGPRTSASALAVVDDHSVDDDDAIFHGGAFVPTAIIESAAN
jgi:hypothetical protein